MFLMHSILSIMYPQHKYDTATILIFNDLIIILTQFQYVSDLGSKHMYIVRQLNNYHAYFTTKMGEGDPVVRVLSNLQFSTMYKIHIFKTLLNCVGCVHHHHQLLFLTFANFDPCKLDHIKRNYAPLDKFLQQQKRQRQIRDAKILLLNLKISKKIDTIQIVESFSKVLLV